MKPRGFAVSARIALLCACWGVSGGAAQTLSPVIVPEENPQTAEDLLLVWDTEPGVRYEVRESGNLQTWSVVDGYPLAAEGITQQMPLIAGESARFFQVRSVDEHPPLVVSRSPADGAFAVRRSASLVVKLTDATGINGESFSLQVGDSGPFTVADAALSFTNGLITLTNDGSLTWGDYGATVPVSLVMADTLGNRGTNTWAFELESEPKVTADLLVLGSMQAVRAGQRVGPTPMSAVARRYGGAAALQGNASAWALESVEPDRLILTYTDSPPTVLIGTYVCNFAPRTVSEIFYRKVTGVTDDSTSKQLTLQTKDVPMEELIEEGSVAVGDDSVLLTLGEEGRIQRAVAFDAQVTFDPIGFSLDGANVQLRGTNVPPDGQIINTGFTTTLGEITLDVGDDPVWLDITAEELHWWLTPSIRAGMDFRAWRLQRFEGVIRGDLESALVLDVDVTLRGAALELTVFDVPKASEPRVWVFLGAIGVPPAAVPVYAQVKFDLQLKVEAEAAAKANFRTGLRQSAAAEFGINYLRDRDPAVRWVHDVTLAPTDLVRPEAALTGEVSLKLKLEPSLSFLVYGLAGAKASVAPRGGIVVETDFAESLTGRLEADVSLSLEPDGPALKWLEPKPALSLIAWEDQWHLFPNEEALRILKQPTGATVQEDASVRFSVTVNRSSDVTYTWFHDGELLPHQTRSYLDLVKVNWFHSGGYTVRIKAGHETVESDQALLTVQGGGGEPHPVPGMVWIPPGAFTMGSADGELGRNANEGPQTLVTLTRGFWIAKYEVTQRQFLELMGRNPSRFQGDLDRPVESVLWADAVAFCSRLTQREKTAGKLPKGYEYRLPTEAQWEYACRAGTSTRYSFGNASECGEGCSPCSFLDQYIWWCGNASYSTQKVGQKLPNPWGLHDMHGNAWEWCWDWYGAYPGNPVSDPEGASTSELRAVRGGSSTWNGLERRSAVRFPLRTDTYHDLTGFRVVLVTAP